MNVLLVRDIYFGDSGVMNKLVTFIFLQLKILLVMTRTTHLSTIDSIISGSILKYIILMRLVKPEVRMIVSSKI